MSIQDAATMVQGKASGGNPTFTGVSTDTRTVRAGELFVALRGDRFDGHGFLKAAASARAAAAMVDSRYHGEYPVPALVVEDTKRALGDLARYWRARRARRRLQRAASSAFFLLIRAARACSWSEKCVRLPAISW